MEREDEQLLVGEQHRLYPFEGTVVGPVGDSGPGIDGRRQAMVAVGHVEGAPPECDDE